MFATFKRRRFQGYLGGISILTCITQVVGWTTISNHVVYSYEDCTYNISGLIQCKGDQAHFEGYDHQDICPGIPESMCDDVKQIRSLFIASIAYPLLYLFYLCCFTSSFFMLASRKYIYMKCAQFFWLICFFVCMCLLFSCASKISNLTYKDIKVDEGLKNICVLLGILFIIKLCIVFGLNNDFNNYIKESQQQINPLQNHNQQMFSPQVNRNQIEEQQQINQNNTSQIQQQNSAPLFTINSSQIKHQTNAQSGIEDKNQENNFMGEAEQ